MGIHIWGQQRRQKNGATCGVVRRSMGCEKGCRGLCFRHSIPVPISDSNHRARDYRPAFSRFSSVLMGSSVRRGEEQRERSQYRGAKSSSSLSSSSSSSPYAPSAGILQLSKSYQTHVGRVRVSIIKIFYMHAILNRGCRSTAARHAIP